MNKEIATSILYCADNSLIGILEYSKDNKISEHKVFPMDVHKSTAKDATDNDIILYCWEPRDRKGKTGTRQFFVDQIKGFKPTNTHIEVRFTPKPSLHGHFDKYAKNSQDDNADETDNVEKSYMDRKNRRKQRRRDINENIVNPVEQPVANAFFDERRVMRIAQKIMEFSGAEAHLYVPDKREDSYDEVGDDGRG